MQASKGVARGWDDVVGTFGTHAKSVVVAVFLLNNKGE